MLKSEFYLDDAVQKDMRYISDRVREARENYGESQMDFAETLQITRNTVIRQESTLHNITLDYLLRVLHATQIPVSNLFPPEIRGEAGEIEKMYLQLNDDNKYIVQNAVKSMMIGMLASQTREKKRMS